MSAKRAVAPRLVGGTEDEDRLEAALAAFVEDRQRALRARTPAARRALTWAAHLRLYAAKLDAPVELVGAEERQALSDVVDRVELAALTLREPSMVLLVNLVFELGKAAHLLQQARVRDQQQQRVRDQEAARIAARTALLYSRWDTGNSRWDTGRLEATISEALETWALVKRGSRPRLGESAPRDRKVEALAKLCKVLRIKGDAEEHLASAERVLRRLHRSR